MMGGREESDSPPKIDLTPDWCAQITLHTLCLQNLYIWKFNRKKIVIMADIHRKIKRENLRDVRLCPQSFNMDVLSPIVVIL